MTCFLLHWISTHLTYTNNSLLPFKSDEIINHLVKYGVPKGWILGPPFSSIYVDDVPNCILLLLKSFHFFGETNVVFRKQTLRNRKRKISNIFNLLGQGSVPQASTSFGPPKFCSIQFKPPNCATGLVQVLDLERVLPPQVTGHAVHCVHWV